MTAINTLFGKKRKGMVFGLEFEIEGNGLPRDIDGWVRKDDPSLRGESAEYVTRVPKPLAATLLSIDKFAAAFEGVELTLSERTSVHVHVNVGELTTTQVFNIVTLYMLFENYLVGFCGKHREGNLFCLRIGDADGVVDSWLTALEKGFVGRIGADLHRYCAVNLAAIPLFGSIEYRSMRGTIDPVVVKTWVGLLASLHRAALRYESPVYILRKLSMEGAAAIAADTFDNVDVLKFEEGWERDVLYHARGLQELAMLPDWKRIEEELAPKQRVVDREWDHVIFDEPMQIVGRNNAEQRIAAAREAMRRGQIANPRIVVGQGDV